MVLCISDADINLTLIVSHVSDHETVTCLKEALERSHEVKLKRIKDTRTAPSTPNTDEDTNNLIEEMKPLNGVLVLCSEKMVELMNDSKIKETKELEVQRVIFLRYTLTIPKNPCISRPSISSMTPSFFSLLLRGRSTVAKKLRREGVSGPGTRGIAVHVFQIHFLCKQGQLYEIHYLSFITHVPTNKSLNVPIPVN